jgi:phage-related protein
MFSLNGWKRIISIIMFVLGFLKTIWPGYAEVFEAVVGLMGQYGDIIYGLIASVIGIWGSIHGRKKEATK